MDKNYHRNIFEKLVKHFDTYGFPQPLKGRDVGMIRDWRFLSGDTNSRTYEVERADKHIGEHFGRVIYWLICSAHRIPSGMAVIAYYDQHISLLKWLGPRFGYRVINALGDLNMSGPHVQMNKKLRGVFDTWVIIMPSEANLAKKRAASAKWSNVHQNPENQASQSSTAPGVQAPTSQEPGLQASRPHVIIPQGSSPQLPTSAASTVPPSGGRLSISESVSSADAASIVSQGPAPSRMSIHNANVRPSSQHQAGVPAGQTTGTLPTMSPAESVGPPSRQSSTTSVPPKLNVGYTQPQPQGSNPISALHKVEELEKVYRRTYVPLCEQFIANPPRDLNILKLSHAKLSESIMIQIITKLDEIETGNDGVAQARRKGLVDEVQGVLGRLDSVYKENSTTIPSELDASYVSVSAHENIPPHSTYQDFSPIAELAATSGPIPTELPATGPSAHSSPTSVQTAAANLASVSLSPVSSFSSARPPSMPGPSAVTSEISQPQGAAGAHNLPGMVKPAPAPSNQPTAGGPGAVNPGPRPNAFPSTGAPGRPGTIRRKAPPPPRKVILATALYDFEPEEEGGEELAFNEGDSIEIVEKTQTLEEDGWCKARIKGQKRIGLAPLEYLEILPGQPSTVGPTRPGAPTVATVQEQATTDHAASSTSSTVLQDTSSTTAQNTADFASSSSAQQDANLMAQTESNLNSSSSVNTTGPVQTSHATHDENIDLNVTQSSQQPSISPTTTSTSTAQSINVNVTNSPNAPQEANKPPLKPSAPSGYIGDGAAPPAHDLLVQTEATGIATPPQGTAAEYYSAQGTLPPASNAVPQTPQSVQMPYRPHLNQQPSTSSPNSSYYQRPMYNPQESATQYGSTYDDNTTNATNQFGNTYDNNTANKFGNAYDSNTLNATNQPNSDVNNITNNYQSNDNTVSIGNTQSNDSYLDLISQLQTQTNQTTSNPIYTSPNPDPTYILPPTTTTTTIPVSTSTDPTYFLPTNTTTDPTSPTTAYTLADADTQAASPTPAISPLAGLSTTDSSSSAGFVTLSPDPSSVGISPLAGLASPTDSSTYFSDFSTATATATTTGDDSVAMSPLAGMAVAEGVDTSSTFVDSSTITTTTTVDSTDVFGGSVDAGGVLTGVDDTTTNTVDTTTTTTTTDTGLYSGDGWGVSSSGGYEESGYGEESQTSFIEGGFGGDGWEEFI